MNKYIPNGKNIAIKSLYKPINQVLPQIPELGIWYPSIKFGDKINLKCLRYSVLLDWRSLVIFSVIFFASLLFF